MSKSLKRVRNFVIISLLTYSLVLLISTSVHGQTNATSELQIKGITQTIQGRSLTIPDFEDISFDALSKYQRSFESEIRQFPQLKNTQLIKLDSRTPQSILPELLAIADNYWSKAEYTDSNVPNSQYVSGTVTCSGQNKPVAPPAGLAASYLELSDYAGKNGASYGKRWVSGDQMVDGGCGILKAINGGKEPTGRLVWGTDAFKIVLDEASERSQQATFRAYMRLCANPPTGRTCTPYFIRLPWFPVSGNNWVAIGGGAI